MQVTLNGTSYQFDPPPATVAELVRAQNLEGKRVAVEMNGEMFTLSTAHDVVHVFAGC